MSLTYSQTQGFLGMGYFAIFLKPIKSNQKDEDD